MNNVNYRHHVDNNNTWRHYPISVESTWATKHWPGRCHAYFLALTEVNVNCLRGYLVDGVNVDPRLDFWHQLVW